MKHRCTIWSVEHEVEDKGLSNSTAVDEIIYGL